MLRARGGDQRAVFVVAAAAAVTVLAGALYKATCSGTVEGQYLRYCYSDIPALYHARGIADGLVPYLQADLEYPVLTGLWMYLAGVPSTTAVAFFLWTMPLLAAGAWVTAYLLGRELGWRRALVFAVAPSLLVVGGINWDTPSTAAAVAAVVAARRGRDGWAGVWVGVGVAMKLWPGLLLVGLLPAAWRLRGPRAALMTAGASAATWLALNVPVALVDFDRWFEFFRFNSARGINTDALWYVARRSFGLDVAASTVNQIAMVAVLLTAVVVGVVTVRRAPATRWVHIVTPVLAVFLVTNKVYSPQYTLWLLPLLALSFPGWRWIAAVGVTDVAVNVFEWPFLYQMVEGSTEVGLPYEPFAVSLVVRAVVLLGAAFVGWWLAINATDDHRVRT